MNNTVLSWGIFLVLAGLAGWYYGPNKKDARHRGRSLQRTTTTTTSTKGPVQWPDSEAKPTPKPSKAKASRKPVKKAAQEVGNKAEVYLSTASSTAGADADDDLSPIASPSLGATTAIKAPSGRDVSDMLESQGAAPAVLRINPSEKPARQYKPQQQRADTPQETKKQRQNRKKVEEAKAQREADEKQRRVLLEKQKRTAREARGESARNGLQAAQTPTSNAWTTVRSSSGAGASSAHNGQLLDTFDPDIASTTSSSEAATNGTAPTPDSMSNSSHWTNLPSEEEQLRLAMEDSAWTTVPKGKKQRKTKAPGDTTEEGSDSGVPQEAAPVQKVSTKHVENAKPQSRFELLSEPVSEVAHPLDSDWPVV